LSAWIPEYAYSKGAVLLMPNYRLMPEANGFDILDDMSDFWSWVTGGKLQEYLSGLEGENAVDVDTERIWAHGESAGTYHTPISSNLFFREK
jgi:acetyl esterase/lipase